MIAQANINDNLIFAFIFLSPVKVEMTYSAFRTDDT